MDDDRRRHAVERPAGAADPPAPIDLFGIHEVAFVQQAGSFDRRAAHHERGAQGKIDRERTAAVERSARIAAVPPRVQQPPGSRREKIKPKLEQAGETERAVLKPPVRIAKLCAGPANLGMRRQKTRHLPDRVFRRLGVGVQEEDEVGA